MTSGMKYERTVFHSLFNMRPAKEGIDAFINKRKANFDGM